MVPMEIVNAILVYVGELNNDIIITQYNMITNKECYKINFYSDLLWKIKAIYIMKRVYPIYSSNFNKGAIELYKSGVLHYEQQLIINQAGLHK